MRYRKADSDRRKGAILLLTALLMTFLMAMVAFSVDLGYVVVVKQRLQNAADAAALAGAAKLSEVRAQATNGYFGSEIELAQLVEIAESQARAEAKLFGSKNRAGGKNLVILDEDVVFGYRESAGAPFQTPVPAGTFPNAVRVTTRRDASVSTGPVSLFFAPVLGVTQSSLHALAEASVDSDRLTGFRGSPALANAKLLPIALDAQAFQALLDGTPAPDGYEIADNYTWQADEPVGSPAKILNDPDGVPELRGIYPNNNAPGSFGLIDVGPDANNAPAFWNWIANGPSPEDLQYLAENRNGVPGSATWHATTTSPATLKAGPGLKASDDYYLQQIIGQPRIMLLYSQVQDNGENTTYEVVGFAGVTILEAELNGNDKHITIQPVVVTDQTVRTGTETQGSTVFIYKGVSLTK